MNPAGGRFTVVIASLCDDARGELIKRACASVRSMAGDLDYSTLVIANGSCVSSRVLDWLATQPDVRVIRLRSGSHPLARRVGAEIADSEFIGFLDDDDELMPNTLGKKIAEFRQRPELDVLITDGLRVNGSRVKNIFPPPEARSADLIETMMHAGWSAGALTLRAQSVDLSALDTEVRYDEWTLTTLELVRRHRFAFLDEPMYRYNEDTANSLSKTEEHNFGAPLVWRRLSLGYAGTRYAAIARHRYVNACHDVAWEYARRGRLHDAWRVYAESLWSPGGLESAPFLPRLLAASLRGLFR